MLFLEKNLTERDINMEIGTELDASDRISQLPDHILHHILSYLPTRCVTRTRVLSKTWNRVWKSFPISDFSDSMFGLRSVNIDMIPPSRSQERRKEFLKFVKESLLRQCHQGIQRLGLSMTLIDYDDHELYTCIDSLFTLAKQHGVSEFDLNFEMENSPSGDDLDYLPEALFSAESLTVFKLRADSRLTIDPNVVTWPSLRVLSLSQIYVDEDLIQNLIRSCPLLEKLALEKWKGLTSIQLSNCKFLKEVRLSQAHDQPLEKIVIEVPSLQTFHYSGGLDQSCHVDMSSCKNVELLTLKIEDYDKVIACQDIVDQFPALKVLILDCSEMETIKILNRQLEKLQVKSHHGRKADVTIIGSSIQSLEYIADGGIGVFSVDGSSIIPEVTLKLIGSLITKHFLILREFLENFQQIERLTVQVHPEVIYFGDKPEILKDIFVPALSNVKQLKLQIIDTKCGNPTQLELKSLLNCLFRICHPESLLLISLWGPNNELIKILCRKLMRRVNRKHWGILSLIKRWRQPDLEGVHIKHLQLYVETEAIKCSALLRSTQILAPAGKKVRFVFTW